MYNAKVNIGYYSGDQVFIRNICKYFCERQKLIENRILYFVFKEGDDDFFLNEYGLLVEEYL